MKKADVPQHHNKSMAGQRKALYAQDDDGQFAIVPSSGWDAEEVVLDQAIAEFQRLTEDAFQRASQGLTSPLEYHMFKSRMDVVVLAQATGFFQWQVKRHLKPGAFAKLSARKQLRYEEALDMSAAQLQQLPATP